MSSQQDKQSALIDGRYRMIHHADDIAILDETTHLMWECKTEDGLRAKHDKYIWSNVSGNCFKGNGLIDKDAKYNTQYYVSATNAQHYCGHSDWRLPTRGELKTLRMGSKQSHQLHINAKAFPEEMFGGWHWSSSEQCNSAWGVSFDDGMDSAYDKSNKAYIRLVRSCR